MVSLSMMAHVTEYVSVFKEIIFDPCTYTTSSETLAIRNFFLSNVRMPSLLSSDNENAQRDNASR